MKTTTEEMITIMQAFADGKEIEHRGSGGWLSTKCPSWNWGNVDYRIKPVEPIYEWQWFKDGYIQDLGFYTEDELEDYPNWVYQKVEETKRVRT